MKKRQANKIENRKLREAARELKHGRFLLRYRDLLVVGEILSVKLEEPLSPHHVPELEITVITDRNRIRSLK